MKKSKINRSKINRFAVSSLQLAVLLLLICGQTCLYADQMPEEVIGANEDDGHEFNTATCAVVLAYVSMRYGSTDSLAYFRFTTIPIPQGATIDACTLFVSVFAAYDDPDIDIFCEDTSSATTLVTEDNCISSRNQTTASVEWIGTDIGDGYKPSPQLKTIVQEVINRDDWSEDNNLAFICVVNPASAFGVDSYEDTGAKAKLHIWYTTGAPPEVDKPRKNIMKGGTVK